MCSPHRTIHPSTHPANRPTELDYSLPSALVPSLNHFCTDTTPSNMTILNVHAGSLPSFALRLKQTDSLSSLRQKAAAKIRLQLDDGIPLAVKYGWKGERYSLEDDDDWEIFTERVGNEKEVDGKFN